jgi:hypothetical protein
MDLHRKAYYFLKLATLTHQQALDILGLQSPFTQEQLNKAYRERVLEFHPDVNPSPEAHAKTVEINAAKEILDAMVQDQPQIEAEPTESFSELTKSEEPYSYQRGVQMDIKDLHPAIQKALRHFGYNKRDVEVKISPNTKLSGYASGDGSRLFFAKVDLKTGQVSSQYGNFGGKNMFEKSTVDWDENVYAIPDDTAIILGKAGQHIFATVVLPPSMAPATLTQEEELPELQEKILAIFRLKAGYRKQYLAELGPGVADAIEQLIAAEYIKRSGVGLQLTTKGKNASEKASRKHRGY